MERPPRLVPSSHRKKIQSCTGPRGAHCIGKLYVSYSLHYVIRFRICASGLGVASIAFLWITVASLLWPEEVVKELFVIPIAALFAFTSVRSNMPGAPKGFGEPERQNQSHFLDDL